MADMLKRFIFDDSPVRGEWVQLTQSWQTVLARRTYPVEIERALGEMMAAAVLLTATVKMAGRLVLQIKSTAAVSLLMVECSSDYGVRALAQWDETQSLAGKTWQALVGDGHLAITIETEAAKQPYQGVVGLADTESLATAIDTYFEQSEQLGTRIWLAADGNSAGGLLLQQLPSDTRADAGDDDVWETATQLANTVTAVELRELDAENLLDRLFNEFAVRLLAEDKVIFRCSCSQERVAGTLRLLGQQEINDILAEQGEVEIGCQFCNQHYTFDAVDIAAVFSEGAPVADEESPILH